MKSKLHEIVKTFKKADYADSIIRRSFMLLFITAPALLLNFIYLVGASRILEMALFGILYTAISTINILTGPAQIFNLYLVRRIAQVSVLENSEQVWAEYRAYLSGLLKWGASATVIIVILGLFGVLFLEFESKSLVVWIVVTSFVLYISESIRGVLQGIQEFLIIGYFLLCYLGLRLILSLGALVQFNLVWPGIVGIALAALTTFLLFDRYLYKRLNSSPLKQKNVSIESNPKNTLIILGYFSVTVLMMLLLMYGDNLGMFFLFSKDMVGVYSRACVWPKTLYILTLPVVQVFFPVLITKIASDSVETDTYPQLMKSLLVTFIISISLIVFLYIIPESLFALIMGDHEAISVEVKLIRLLPIALTPLCLLRVIIFEQLARNKYIGTISLLPAFLFQMGVISIGVNSLIEFQTRLIIANWAVFFTLGYLLLYKDRRL